MRFFPLLDYQDWILGLFLGIVLVILLYLAFTGYTDATGRSGKRREQVIPYPDGIEGGHHVPPLFIVFLYMGFAIWIIFYVIYVGIRGGAI
jgi:hypothetical protein